MCRFSFLFLFCPSVWSVTPKSSNVANISSACLHPCVASGQFFLLLFLFVLQPSLCEVTSGALSSLPQRSLFSESSTHGPQRLKQWLNKHRDTAWAEDSSSSSSHEFCSRSDDHRDTEEWVGFQDAYSQSEESSVAHSLPPLCSYVSISPSSPLLCPSVWFL